MASTKITGVRIPSDLLNTIQQMADTDSRKISQQIILMLKSQVEKQHPAEV